MALVDPTYFESQKAKGFETPEEAEKQREADRLYEEECRKADFKGAGEKLLAGLNMGTYNPYREAQAAELIACEEQQEKNPKKPHEIMLAEAFDDFTTDYPNTSNPQEEGNSEETIVGETYTEENPEPLLTAEGGQETLVGSAGGDTLAPNREQNERKNTPGDDAPFTPIIKSLLPERDYRQAVIEALQNSTLDNPKLEILDKIDGLPTEEKSKLTERINSLLSQDENKLEQRKQDLERDFGPDINDFKIGSGSKKGQFNNESDLAAFERLAHQYFPENTDNPEEKRRALDTAFKTALNFEINGKSLDKNQESYKKAVATIRDDTASFHDRFTALKSIIIYIGVDQGKGGAQREREYRKKVAETLLGDKRSYERFMELLLQYHTAPEHSKIEISQELEQIRDNCGVTPGDAALLAGGVLDRLREHTTTAKEIA